MGKPKVLLVDDSPLIVKVTGTFLQNEEGIDYLGSAANHDETIAFLSNSKPHIVVLDYNLPGVDGTSLITEIRDKYTNVLILMYTSNDTLKNSRMLANAMSSGVVDFAPKPCTRDGITLQESNEKLLHKIMGLHTGAKAEPPKEASQVCNPRYSTLSKIKYIVIGSSTGGPEALKKVLMHLSEPMPPILIVQHMSKEFSKVLATDLNRHSGLYVHEVMTKTLIQKDHIYIASGGTHMVLEHSATEGDYLLPDYSPEVHYCRPSVDKLLSSMLQVIKPNRILLTVLTGMGHDGVDGATKINAEGGHVIIQDKATSVVWGMPGAIAEQCAYNEMVSLEEVPKRISALCDKYYRK